MLSFSTKFAKPSDEKMIFHFFLSQKIRHDISFKSFSLFSLVFYKSQNGLPLETKNTQNYETRRLGLILP